MADTNQNVAIKSGETKIRNQALYAACKHLVAHYKEPVGGELWIGDLMALMLGASRVELSDAARRSIGEVSMELLKEGTHQAAEAAAERLYDRIMNILSFVGP